MDTTGKSWSAEYLPEDDKYIMSFGESTPAFEGLTRYEGDTSAYSGMYLGSVGYRNGRWFTDPWMEAGIDPPKELDLRPARTYRYPSDEELREIIGPKEWPGEKMVGEEPMRKFSRDRTRCPKCAGRPQIRVRILTNTSALQDSSVLLSCIECGWEWRELAMDQQAEDPDEELADRFLVMAPRGGEVEREFFGALQDRADEVAAPLNREILRLLEVNKKQVETINRLTREANEISVSAEKLARHQEYIDILKARGDEILARDPEYYSSGNGYDVIEIALNREAAELDRRLAKRKKGRAKT